MTDWSHQGRALAELRKHFAQGKTRGVLVLPTGGGKTRTALEMIRLSIEKGRRALFVADRRVLVFQAAKAADSVGIPCGVAMNEAGPGWSDPGAPLQIVSKDSIASWLSGRHRYQPPPADLIVTDECHRSSGSSWKWLEQVYPNAWEVGLSATPCQADGKGLGYRYQFLVQPTSYSELISRGVLVEPVCYSPTSAGPLGKALKPSSKSLVGDPVTWWKKYADGCKTFAFCSDVSHSLFVRDEYRRAGVRAEHIDGNTPDEERDAVLKRLATGETTVVTSCAVLRYGVDVPSVECAQILAPMGSLVDYLQSCGRVLRSSPGKSRAIVIDHAGAVLYHGFPHADTLWQLAEEVDHGQERRKPRSDEPDQTPIGCPVCGMLFSKLPACPGCGWVPKKQAKERVNKSGTLQKVCDSVASHTEQDLNSIWRTALGICANKGYALNRAAVIFQKKAGKLPWQCKLTPWVPDGIKWNRLVSEIFPQFVRKRQGVPDA